MLFWQWEKVRGEPRDDSLGDSFSSWFCRIEGRTEEESLSSNGKNSLSPPAVRPYKPHVHYPQRVAWSKLSELGPRFVQFLNILRRMYDNVLFLEALRKHLLIWKFWESFFLRKMSLRMFQWLPLEKPMVQSYRSYHCQRCRILAASPSHTA